MKKYMVTFYLPDELDENFWELVKTHRAHISKLMEQEIIFSYAINQLRTIGWIVMNAESEKDVAKIIENFPIYSYLTYDMDELLMFDASAIGLPKLVLN